MAVVAVPVLLTSASGEELLAPLALFQFGSATTPATSVEAMGISWPTKSILIALPEEPLAVVTMRTAVVVVVSAPLVPVMARVELPIGVLDAAATVSVELAPAVT